MSVGGRGFGAGMSETHKARGERGRLFNIPVTCTCSCLCHITRLIKHQPITTTLINGSSSRREARGVFNAPLLAKSRPSLLVENQIICLARLQEAAGYDFNAAWLSEEHTVDDPPLNITIILHFLSHRGSASAGRHFPFPLRFKCQKRTQNKT